MRIRLVVAILAAAAHACSGSCSPDAESSGGTVSDTAKKSPVAAVYDKKCNADLEAARAAFAVLEGTQPPQTVATVLEPLNELWMIVDRALNTAQLYRNVHPDEELRDAAETCEQEFQKLVTDLGLSRPLFDATSKVDTTKQDAVTQRYVEHLLRDFRRAGVDKDEATRA
ncbi:MAG: hypothetical protein V3T05_03780, partial [Myxococcota bacterium]